MKHSLQRRMGRVELEVESTHNILRDVPLIDTVAVLSNLTVTQQSSG